MKKAGITLTHLSDNHTDVLKAFSFVVFLTEVE